MAERRRYEQLDQAVEAMMTDAPRPEIDPSIEALLQIAADLRDLPRQDFKHRLKRALGATSPAPVARSVTPYLQVENAARLIDFLKQAFDGEELCRVPGPQGVAHAEVRIGDSLLQMADATDEFPTAPAAIHVYVPDVDAVHARALDAGAHSILEPFDQDYGDRDASIRDPFGNHWYIATHRGSGAPARPDGHVPEGLPNVMPYLHPHGAPRLIDFLTRAFAAEETFRHQTPDGVVVHATLRIGDAILEMGEAHGAFQPMRPAMHLRVDDADAAYERALAAGAASLFAPSDREYGERLAGVRDPFDNVWYLGAPLKPK